MNKKQIRDKNIVLDVDESELKILIASFGISLEDVFRTDGWEERREMLLHYLKSHRTDIFALMNRLSSLMTALKQKV